MKRIIFTPIDEITSASKEDVVYMDIAVLSALSNDLQKIKKVAENNYINNIKIEEKEIAHYYNLFLNKLVYFLNKSHGKNYSKVYWETLIGTWLYFFVSRNLYIYKKMKRNVNNREKFISSYYEKDDLLGAIDIEDGLRKLFYDDIYNALIYSVHIKYFENIIRENKQIPCKKMTDGNIVINKKKRSIDKIIKGLNKPRKILGYIGNILYGSILENLETMIGYDNKVVIRLPYPTTFHRKKNLLKLLFKSNLRIIPYMNKKYHIPNLYDKNIRKDLVSFFYAGKEDNFQRIMCELIAYCIPSSYLENYSKYEDGISKKIGKKPKKIFGIVPIRTNDDFTFYVAYWREKGVAFLDAQHGLDYEFFPDIGVNEYRVIDIFYTWGYKYKSDIVKTEAFVAWDLEKKFEYNQRNINILYATTDYGKYSSRLLYSRFLDYMYDIILFLNKIDEDIHSNIILRIRDTSDKDWEYSTKIKYKCPRVNISYADKITFIEELKKARVFVCDNISTCIAEALVNNVPTIIFLNINIDKKIFYEDSIKILDKLKQAKILFYSPEDAAKHLNLVYDDLEKWWNDPFTQQIKKEFCEGYIRTDSNWLDKWCDLLMSEEKA